MNLTHKKLRLIRMFDQVESEEMRDRAAEAMLEVQRKSQSNKKFPLTLRIDESLDGCGVVGLDVPKQVKPRDEFECPRCGGTIEIVEIGESQRAVVDHET